MTDGWKSNYTLNYRDHMILVKQDFGSSFHLIDGMPTNIGYVVVKDGVNVMPGAVWFQTVKQARRAVDLLILTEGNVELFYKAMNAYNGR
jgi:hypothetical protein